MTKFSEAARGDIKDRLERQREPCSCCGLTRYEHVDHDHDRLVRANGGRCPFGDCVKFLGGVRRDDA